VAGSRWTDSDHVSTTSVGTRLHASRVFRAFHDALLRAGLPRVRIHDLRHSTATYLLACGMTLQDLKDLLGHSSIVLTSDTYGHCWMGGETRWRGRWRRCWAGRRGVCTRPGQSVNARSTALSKLSCIDHGPAD
jgi:integrase